MKVLKVVTTNFEADAATYSDKLLRIYISLLTNKLGLFQQNRITWYQGFCV